MRKLHPDIVWWWYMEFFPGPPIFLNNDGAWVSITPETDLEDFSDQVSIRWATSTGHMKKNPMFLRLENGESMKLSTKQNAQLYFLAYSYCRGNAEDIGFAQDWAKNRAASTGKKPVDCLRARMSYCPEYSPADNEVGSLPDIA
jgi:hypothetical protein